jgi:phosphopantothenoylcysteine decarboxylase/phosphopantothenate--cysteine ligase
MLDAVMREVESFKPHMVILAAAPVDFKPTVRIEGKLRSDSTPVTIELTLTPKIAKEVADKIRESGVLVLFAAEAVNNDDELLRLALKKKEKYQADVVVANNIARRDIGFSSEYNEVIVVYGRENKMEKISKRSKRLITRRILDIAGGLVEQATLC